MIYSAQSSRPVEEVHILLFNEHETYETVSSSDGSFSVEVRNEGRFSMKATHVSFSEYQDEITIQCSHGSFHAAIYLAAKDYSLDEVSVHARQSDEEKSLKINEYSSVSYHLLTVERMQMLPAIIGDPGRMAAALPGVVIGESDSENEVVVRGNSPRGNTWRIENIDVTSSLSHFSAEGASGGMISMISQNVMGPSEFFTSAYPANYGNAYGGIFDIRFRTGSKEDYRLKFTASAIGIELGHEGNIANKHTYLFNYRYSTLALIEKTGINIKGIESPQYQDFNYKTAFPFRRGGEISFFGINGGSSIYSESTVETAGGEEVISRTSDNAETTAFNGVSLSKSYSAENKIEFRAAHHYSNNVSDFTERSKADILEPGYRRYRKNFLTAHFNYRFQPNEHMTLTAGTIFNQWHYDLGMRAYSSYPDTSGLVLDSKGNTQMYQAYATVKKQFNSPVDIIVGLHSLYNRLNKKYSLEPRIFINWRFTAKSKLSYGFGMHSKAEDLTFYLTKNGWRNLTPANHRDLDLIRSVHNVVSYKYAPNEAIRISIETYYQFLYHISVGMDSIETFTSTINGSGPSALSHLDDVGTAYNYGIDASVTFNSRTRWLAILNASLYDSKYRDALDVKRNTAWNNNFSLYTVIGKEHPVGKEENGKIRWGFTFILMGGRRYVPIDLEKSIISRDDEFIGSEAYERRVDPYFRVDAQFAYSLTRPKYRWEIKLDIQNLTNRENVVGEDYVPNYGIATDKRGQIIPILSSTLDFQFKRKK